MDPNVKPQTWVETLTKPTPIQSRSICHDSHNVFDLYCVNIHNLAQLQRYEETANSFTKDHDRREIKLSCNSAYEHKDVIDIDGIITDFGCLKGTHLALCL